MISKVNHKTISHSCQCPICGIKECVRSEVVTWLNPFSFEHSPKNLGNVELWRMRWNEELVQSSPFPQLTEREQFPCPMYRRIVKYNDSLPVNGQREIVKEADHCVCVNAACRREPACPTLAVNHGEAVEPRTSLRRDVNVFLVKLPSVRHTGILAKMGFVSVIKFYGTVMPQSS